MFSTTQTDQHLADVVVELIAPQGRFGLIDDPEELNTMPLKLKAVSLHWEMMFARSLFGETLSFEIALSVPRKLAITNGIS